MVSPRATRFPDAVVLWTRVTPTAQAIPGSGPGPRVAVRWEVALDDHSAVVRSGHGPHRRRARPHGQARRDRAQSRRRLLLPLHVSPTTLSPVGAYAYGTSSGQPPERLRFGVVSCANWQAGWFNSYRHLAERGDLDAVIHLGDYLYEYQPGKYSYGPATRTCAATSRRGRSSAWPTTGSGTGSTRPTLTCRRCTLRCRSSSRGTTTRSPTAAGPTERSSTRRERGRSPIACARRNARTTSGCRCDLGHGGGGGRAEVYRRLQFGQLVDLSMLDLRSYRSERVDEDDPAIDAGRTITGEHQLGWLKGNLASSPCRWKLIGNPVMVAPVRLPPRPAAEQYALSQTVSFTPLGHRRPTPMCGTATPPTASGCSASSRPTARRRRVPQRRRAHGVGQRRARPERQRRRHRARVQLDHQQQRRRLHRRSAAYGLAVPRGSDPDREPARTVRQPRRPRLLRPRGDARHGSRWTGTPSRPARPAFASRRLTSWAVTSARRGSSRSITRSTPDRARLDSGLACRP